MQRSELIDYFLRVRRDTEILCEPLAVEDYVIQPIIDVSPPKWHLGHTTWFYEAMFLDKYVNSYKVFHPQYAFVFNSYYESFGVRVSRDSRGCLSRPTVSEIQAYRTAIDQRMCDLINTIDEAAWIEFAGLVVLALNHEQQHQELLVADIKYILASNPLRPPYQPELDLSSRPHIAASSYIGFEGGVFEIGYQGEGFHYDNERPLHKQFVHDFSLQNRLVTNEEYLAFITDGGYQDFRFWLSDGWERVKQEQWKGPLYWEQRDGIWFEFTMAGLRELNPSLPVCHVSYYEADAFAHWSGKRLPSEAEWEVAARTNGSTIEGGNWVNERRYHPRPLTAAAPGVLQQMMGDVWEWTASAYLPYHGYRRGEGPLGEYNGKFMIDQMVLRGGSCATPRDHARISYRNFFQADKRWQFKGIRLAE